MVNKKNIKVLTKKVSVFYGDKQAIKDVNLEIFENQVTSLIGPSDAESQLLRCINRMNDTIDICRITGKVLIDNDDIYKATLDQFYKSESWNGFQSLIHFLKVFLTMLHTVLKYTA